MHYQEFIKWANDDAIRQIMVTTPVAEKLLELHLEEMQKAMQPPTPPPEAPKISLALQGIDLQDPQVRQMFDRAEGFGPPPAPTPKPESVPQGGAKAMANSNQNAAPVGNTPQPAVGV